MGLRTGHAWPPSGPVGRQNRGPRGMAATVEQPAEALGVDRIAHAVTPGEVVWDIAQRCAR